MAHAPETRHAVRASYIYERLDLPQAASKHGVSIATAQTWKRQAKKDGDNWDRARSAARMAAGALGDVTNELMEDFALLFKTTVQDIKDGEFTGIEKAEALSRLSDAYTKTMKAATSASPKLNKLMTAFEVINEMASFIAANHPEDVERFANILDKFAVRINEVFG